MTLKEYLKDLQDKVEANPELLDCLVVYSVDDEGNAYGKVECGPLIGFWHEDWREFDPCPEIDEDDEDDEDNKFIPAICIN